MGMSMHVSGFKPADQKWNKMKAIWDACYDAQEVVPENVQKFFNGDPPDKSGVRVELDNHECCIDWIDKDACADGFEIDISKLPNDVKTIRFFCSY